MEIILNRLRGTGSMFTIGSLNINGNILYALYIAMLVGLLSTWYFGLVAGLLYVLGESFGWGEWIGALINGEKVASKARLEEDEGHDTGIHWIANKIAPEDKDYQKYCRVALAIRGFYWWAPLMVYLGVIGLLPWVVVAVNIVALSIGFPLGIWAAKKWVFSVEWWKFKVDSTWERQEVFYGVVQFMCVTVALLLCVLI